MFDYQAYSDRFCKENGVSVSLSFDMPEGYETAYGTYDGETNTVYVNKRLLSGAPDHEKAFYLFHELRHAMQHLSPERFGDDVNRSLPYVILYDGACYKLVNGQYLECRIEGDPAYLESLYAGLPYEKDANTYAYERARSVFGDSEALRELYRFWLPRRQISDREYEAVYRFIDRAAGTGAESADA